MPARHMPVPAIAISIPAAAAFHPDLAMVSTRAMATVSAGRSGIDVMVFLYAAALSFAPVLVAIIAAALILPRAWLASYAVFVVVALVVYADLSGRYDDAIFSGMFSV